MLLRVIKSFCLIFSLSIVSADDAVFKASVGCMDCHTKTDAPSMHKSKAVNLGCTSCHGGNPEVRAEGVFSGTEIYNQLKDSAHILPKNKELWKTSANPERTYADLLKESYEFVKFVNPGDLRVAEETCGGCHSDTVRAVKKSLMTTSAMLWGGASYNNNILPFKVYKLGESYDKDGNPQKLLETEPLNDYDTLKGKLPSFTSSTSVGSGATRG